MTFEEYVATRLDAVLRYAVVLTNDRGLAEDLVQEVLLRVHARWEHIEGLDHPEAYVRRMVTNEFLSWRRKWARIVPSPDTVLDRSETDRSGEVVERNAMLTEVAKLPRKQRAAVVLRYYEGLSDREIGDILGCTDTTVRGYVFRALAKLRIEMTPTATPADVGNVGKET